ncbi:lysophospholipid acyltransferase family protein [Victivallis sp.]|mgnify:FL=1|uniref:lysophospholipid acyltransferase family protein n=1 Tax=Victivallis sp. TaxID=2049020 RepID=UPI003A95DC37
MARSRHEKSKFRIYLEYIPFYLLYRVLHWMPLKWGYAFSDFLFRMLFFIDPRHRRRSIQHLMHAGIAKDHREAVHMAAASIREFGKLLVEIVKMDQLYSPEKITVSGDPEAIDYALSPDHENHQVIIITAHFGNWEVAGEAFSEKARIPMLSMMRSFGNPLIGKMILAHRAGKMHELVDKTEGIRPVLRAINKGKNVTMLIDQHAAGNEGVECVFFGHPARVHMTPALLHLKTGIPILPELTFRTGKNFNFDLRVGKLIRYTPTGNKDVDVQAITQQCISALEQMIREAPLQWLWAPRHWLDINRRQAPLYKDWKPPVLPAQPPQQHS